MDYAGIIRYRFSLLVTVRDLPRYFVLDDIAGMIILPLMLDDEQVQYWEYIDRRDAFDTVALSFQVSIYHALVV